MYNIIYIKNNNRDNSRVIIKQPLEITYTQFPIKTKMEATSNYISLERNKYVTMVNEINSLNRSLITSNKLSEKYQEELTNTMELKNKYNLLLLELRNLNSKRELDIKVADIKNDDVKNDDVKNKVEPKIEHMLSKIVDNMVDIVISDEMIDSISDKIITELFLNT